MYEKTYGTNYAETRDLGVAEIAKLIRTDIKDAVKAGDLPGKPVAYSVRIDRYSMGQSIDIIVKHADFDVFRIEIVEESWGGRNHRVYTDEARAVIRVLDKIHASYNYDGSEVLTDYFDVKYYGQVTFDGGSTAGEEPERPALYTKDEPVRLTVGSMSRSSLGEQPRLAPPTAASPSCGPVVVGRGTNGPASSLGEEERRWRCSISCSSSMAGRMRLHASTAPLARSVLCVAENGRTTRRSSRSS